ncbi:MAG: hypothetical protein Q8880_10025, partial [Bacteroidota bacterium]|nr:hypothetical protein [Bacteroidota bacterium]
YTSEYLNELENKVTRNKDQIQLLKYIVSLDNYYKLKLETQSLLTEELQDNSENNDKKSIELIDNNITQLTTLKSDYNKLWLEYYKPDNLNFINDKFNRLISYFNETKEQIINKKIESPLIKSKWIYKKLKHGKFATEATFYKEFNVKDKPDSVRLQLIGDTYAKLYINDSLVSNVYARKCLSLIVDYKKIKYIDITSYIKPDTINTFEVKVQNFNEKGAAGFNLIAKFYNKGTDYTINSDETWICKNSETKWKYASSKEYPSPVIEPNFKNGRTSWIER